MGLQTIEDHERPAPPPVHFLYPVTETVSASGATGATMLHDVVACMRVADVVAISHWSSNASTGVSMGGVYYTGASDYDPAFVTRVLAADAGPTEATFDNVVDMMSWLERD